MFLLSKKTNFKTPCYRFKTEIESWSSRHLDVHPTSNHLTQEEIVRYIQSTKPSLMAFQKGMLDVFNQEAFLVNWNISMKFPKTPLHLLRNPSLFWRGYFWDEKGQISFEKTIIDVLNVFFENFIQRLGIQKPDINTYSQWIMPVLVESNWIDLSQKDLNWVEQFKAFIEKKYLDSKIDWALKKNDQKHVPSRL